MDGFWQDTAKATVIQKEKNILLNVLNEFKSLETMMADFVVLLEFVGQAKETEAEMLTQETIDLYINIEKQIKDLEQKALLSEEMDVKNAIVSINAGAGGTESCDWAQMLFRMITRFVQEKKFKLVVLDVQTGEVAGIKSCTFLVEGSFAFGLLKSETGIHRLVRISPFDTNARRHTSFASIFVSPEVEEDIQIEIHEKDLKIDVFRAGGAGGQSVNTTDSAVRMTHLPTGIVVNCQNERSQVQNKLMAMKVLKSRLYERAMEEQRAKQEVINAGKKEIGWGSQIRSYVLHPYKLVKDHRTGAEVSSAEGVLDGDLDFFIKSYLQQKSEQKVTE